MGGSAPQTPKNLAPSITAPGKTSTTIQRAERWVTLPGDNKPGPINIGDEDLSHMSNWFECMRSGNKKTNATVKIKVPADAAGPVEALDLRVFDQGSRISTKGTGLQRK